MYGLGIWVRVRGAGVLDPALKTDVKAVFRFIYYHQTKVDYLIGIAFDALSLSSVLLGATHILAGTGDWV